MTSDQKMNRVKKPDWLKITLPAGKKYVHLKDIVNKNKLHTICQSGNCPNLGECWGLGTATFMILGGICTRSCKFCAVETGKPLPPDIDEPKKIANCIKEMQLKACVLTSVDRDDLPDGGANHWAETVRCVKQLCPEVKIETLIPDFQGDEKLLDIVIGAKPDIISHNIETVRRLTKLARNKAIYDRSLKVLSHITGSGITAKSGIMLGLGETVKEIHETIDDIYSTGCSVMTIGQYLQPTREHLALEKYYSPEEFEEFKRYGLEKGFKVFESGPLVRSSYHAEKHFKGL